MAPLIKDAVENTNPASEASQSVPAAPPAPSTKPPSAGLRSEALSLDVAVKIHGSRVKEVVRGITPHTEPFEEQTNTMIVFPQGGVLRMNTPVNAGQMVVLTNLKTRQDAICRVLKVRANTGQQSYVEVEFTSRQPGYWGVNFPTDGPSVPAPAVPPPAARLVAPPTVAANVAPPLPAARPVPAPPAKNPTEISVTASGVQPFIVPPAPPKAAPRPVSTFISIGSHEDVQVAASSTITANPAVPVLEPFGAPRPSREAAKPASPVVNIAALTASLDAVAPVAPAPSISMEELRGDPSPTLTEDAEESKTGEHARAAELDSAAMHVSETHAATESSPAQGFHSPSARPRSSFGTFGGGASLTLGHSGASETFDANADADAGGALSAPAASHQNWILIAACVAVLFVAVAGGIFYFRSLKSGNASAQVPQISTPAAATENPAAQATQVPGGAATAAEVVPAAQPPSASVNAPSPVTAAVTETKKTPASFASQRPAPKPAAHVTNDMVASTLNAHPVAPQHDSAADAGPAPSYDAASGAAQTEALSGAIPTTGSINVPEPKIQPEGPVKIGGQVKEARLLSSVNPTYPVAAREAGVQGDVVINAVIDKSGRVRQMKVVSGPMLLRQAALNAMREWRYSPSTLDGQPIDGQVIVTLRFRK